MCDDGGSSGQLRQQYGVMPPGDIRQCLVALSRNKTLGEMFNTRFESGIYKGHPVGNLLLAGMEQPDQDFEKSVEMASQMLNIVGQVLPVSLEQHILVMRDGDEIIRSEYEIDHRTFNTQTPKVWLEPGVSLNPKAEKALLEADAIVLAAGDLYGSILPALAVKGMKEALLLSPAPVVMISNLTNKPGQTDGWHVADHVRTIEEYTGAGSIDFILFNTAVAPREDAGPSSIHGEEPVGIGPERFREVAARAIGARLLASSVAINDENDTLIKKPRNRIRHDARALSCQLIQIATKRSLTNTTAAS